MRERNHFHRRVLVMSLLLAGWFMAGPDRLNAQISGASGTVLTIAGNGERSYSGDGGPATNAALQDPLGLSIGPDGTLYIADASNFRIRAVAAATGVITTVAGNGSPGDGGDDGPATNAAFGGLSAIALDRARQTLYLADQFNYRVRKVNLTNGVISNFAGVGLFYPFPEYGQRGDGGPATGAWFSGPPSGLAVDRSGNVYISEGCRIRKVDIATGVIHTVAGRYDTQTGGSSDLCKSAGDGGPALQASFSYPSSLAVDAGGNVYITDVAGQSFTSTNIVRRIDFVTGIITTVAGGGTNSSGTGPGTSIDLQAGWVTLSADAAGNALFIALPNKVLKLDLASGEMTPFAGDGTAGFQGDGGPALNAEFRGIYGVAVAPGGGVLIPDTDNQRIRYVVPDSITLTNEEQQTTFYLPWINALAGDLTITNNPGLAAVHGNGVVSVGGALSVSRNDTLASIDLTGLLSANVINIGANASVGSVDLPSLTNVTTVNIGQNATCGSVDLSSLLVAGVVDISSNATCGSLDLTSLLSANVINIGANASVGSVDLPSLTNVTTVNIGQNATCGSVDLSSLLVAGVVDISSNATCGSLDLSNLLSANVINIGANASVGSVDLPSLTNVTTVNIGQNASCGVVDLSSLLVASVINIGSNATCGVIDLSSLTNVTGDITITSNAPNSTVDLSSLCEFGNETNATTITVDGGTVVVTNCLTISSNATLNGSTTLDGSVTNNGTISPGSSPGRLAITGQLALGATSRLRMELGGYEAGSGFDLITVGGSLRLGGNLSVSLIRNFARTMTNGASFTILTAGTPLTGAFGNIASGDSLTTSDGYARFTVQYAAQSSVRLTNLEIVDSDHDGMPDWWEDEFGFNKADAGDAALDSDGDGQSNLNEFLAGTDPKNAASLFRILNIESSAGGRRITWSAVPGKSYQVQTNALIGSGSFGDFGPLIQVLGAGQSVTNLFDGGETTSSTLRFYRVRLGH